MLLPGLFPLWVVTRLICDPFSQQREREKLMEMSNTLRAELERAVRVAHSYGALVNPSLSAACNAVIILCLSSPGTYADCSSSCQRRRRSPLLPRRGSGYHPPQARVPAVHPTRSSSSSFLRLVRGPTSMTVRDTHGLRRIQAEVRHRLLLGTVSCGAVSA